MSDLTDEELRAFQARFVTAAPTVVARPGELSPQELRAYQARFAAPGVLHTVPVRTATGGTLSAADTAYLRSELGADLDLTDAQARYARLGDARQVVLEVVRERLAAFQAGPAQFSVPGVYAQDTSANITALREQLQRVADTTVSGEDAPLTVVQRVQARPRRRR